jgi:hypothetical protein
MKINIWLGLKTVKIKIKKQIFDVCSELKTLICIKVALEAIKAQFQGQWESSSKYYCAFLANSVYHLTQLLLRINCI